MPQLRILTNVELDAARSEELLHKASAEVADMLGKAERFVMVVIEGGHHMSMGGSNEACAYLELKSIGLPEERTAEFSSRLANFVEAHLAIHAPRVYIEFANAERHMWGWDGKTF